MKKNNSILMGMQKTPLNKFGMKLLFIPCLIAVMTLSSFRSEFQNNNLKVQSEKAAATFTDFFVQSTIVPSWVDLEGIEYIDFWIDVLDENYSQAYVTDMTFNYSVSNSVSYYAEYSKPLTGYGPFLIEQYAPYHNPATNLWINYGILPGVGYYF